MASKNRIQVSIGGNDYTLVGTESDDYLKKVALYIDKKMNEITKLNNKLSTSSAAVLAAVNVADDFFKSSDNEAKVKNQYAHALKEIERLKDEVQKLKVENSFLEDRNSNLQLELVRSESELGELKSYNGMNKRQKYA